MSGPNTVIQYSFATGIVSPGVKNRRDWEYIDGAVADLVNGTVGPSGGAHKRPGMRLVNEALHDDKPIRLVEFEFSQDQTYQLEFGDRWMRFYTNRAPILDAAGEPLKIRTPYSAEQAREFTFAQERDAMFFAHREVPPMTLTRKDHVKWEWAEAFKENGRPASPWVLEFFDDASDGHTGHEYGVVAYTGQGTTKKESIYFRSLRSDPAGIDEVAERPDRDIASCIRWIEEKREEYGDLAGYPTYPRCMDLADIAEDADPMGGEYLDARLAPVFMAIYPGADAAYREWRENASGERELAWTVVDADGERLASFPYWGANGPLPAHAGQVAAERRTVLMRDMAIDYINAGNPVLGRSMPGIHDSILEYIERYDQKHSAKAGNRIKWDEVEGATGYRIYRRTMGADDQEFRLIKNLDGRVLEYNDENAASPTVATDTPVIAGKHFAQPGRYPRLVTFYQQRLVFGGTDEYPTSIFGSSVGNYKDFAIVATNNDSGYEFKMASQQSNPLSAILPLYTLVCLTSGGDFISTVSGAMHTGNVNFNQKSYNGSSGVPPVILGDSGLYVPLGQQTINSIIYSYEKDGFAHGNILFQAQALIKNKRIVGLSYQRDPINLIWAVLDDGTLLSCTYIPGQKFQAWTRHMTQGRVQSINTVTSSGGNDEIWLVVQRTLGDGTVRQYLEVLEDMRPYGGTPTAESAFYVDCGLSNQDDRLIATVTDLEHLEGLEVAILADFEVEERQVVRNGCVTLSKPARAVHVGLPYEFRLKTINFELLDQGTLRNTRRAAYRVIAEVEDTRELFCSLSGGEAFELITHRADAFGQPQLVSDDVPFLLPARDTGGAWAEFSSGDPVPCAVLSLVAEVTHGDA